MALINQAALSTRNCIENVRLLQHVPRPPPPAVSTQGRVLQQQQLPDLSGILNTVQQVASGLTSQAAPLVSTVLNVTNTTAQNSLQAGAGGNTQAPTTPPPGQVINYRLHVLVHHLEIISSNTESLRVLAGDLCRSCVLVVAFHALIRFFTSF